MALPLPKVVSDIGPGGGLVTAMRGINALADDLLQNEITGVKAQYAPMSTEADVASKLAYARLVGLQPIGQLLKNPDAFSSLSEDEKRVVLGRYYQAGTGNALSNSPETGMSSNATSNSLASLPSNQGEQDNSPFSFSRWAKGKLKNIFGEDNSAPVQASPSVNTFAYGAQPSPQPQGESLGMPNIQPEPTIEDRALAAWMNSLEGKAAQYKIPNKEVLTDWYRKKQANQPAGKTYSERAAQHSDIKAEGAELGKIRAQSIKEMDDQYQQAIESGAVINHLTEIVRDPHFKKLRDEFPFFQDMQLKAITKLGNAAEQEQTGDFINTISTALSKTISSFPGRILDKEFPLSEKMKVSDNDTWNVMVGKLSTIAMFDEMTKKRSKLATRLMEKHHINKGEALEMADAQVDGEAIRKEINDKLHTPKRPEGKPTDADINFMASKYNISPDEVRKRLKAKGIL